MKRYILSILAVLAVSAPLSAMAAEIGATHALVKIRPGDQPALSDSAWLGAAANEMESFQVVVTGSASAVSAKMGDLEGPGTIPASEVTLYREAYMYMDNASDAQ